MCARDNQRSSGGSQLMLRKNKRPSKSGFCPPHQVAPKQTNGAGVLELAQASDNANAESTPADSAVW